MDPLRGDHEGLGYRVSGLGPEERGKGRREQGTEEQVNSEKVNE
jgi:hypothetical protein